MNYIKSLVHLSVSYFNSGTLLDTLGGFIAAAELPGEWEQADVQKWKLKAFRIQSQYYHFFEGERFHLFSDADSLYRFICATLYKNTKDFCADLFDDDSNVSYNDEQNFIATKILRKIVSISPSTSIFEVGVVFVCCKLKAFEFVIPVFCVKCEGKPKFVDCFSDLFYSWQDWKGMNRLPLMKYCYPANGIYTSVEHNTVIYDKRMEPHLEYGTTPNCDLIKRLQGFSSKELHEECFP